MKKGKFLFQLTRTVNEQAYESTSEETTPLLKLAADGRRHFVLERRGKRRRRSSDQDDEPEPELAPEITQMIEEHLKLSDTSPETSLGRKKKPSRKHFTGTAAEVLTIPSSDYVYDIYHLESVPEKEFDAYKEDSDVGFVKIVYADIDLVPDEDDDLADKPLSDDEDSNEENYYRNDYPEDEDDDRSILFGSEGEEIAITKNSAENPTESYDDLFSRLGNNNNILSSLNAMNFIDLDEGENDGYDKASDPETFPNEQDSDEDPMIAYRDRIFGKLQRMIDER